MKRNKKKGNKTQNHTQMKKETNKEEPEDEKTFNRRSNGMPPSQNKPPNYLFQGYGALCIPADEVLPWDQFCFYIQLFYNGSSDLKLRLCKQGPIYNAFFTLSKVQDIMSTNDISRANCLRLELVSPSSGLEGTLKWMILWGCQLAVMSHPWESLQRSWRALEIRF